MPSAMDVERLWHQAYEFHRMMETEVCLTIRALLVEMHVRQADRLIMEYEWTTTISGHRLVRFTYLDLPEGNAFMTAQIAGHDVVYSVIAHAERPFNRESVERRFDDECPPISH